MVSCFVFGCKTGYHGKRGHLFKISRKASEDTRKLWIKNIPKRKDKPFDFKKSHICSLHFTEDEIIKVNQLKHDNQVIAEEKLQRWRLSDTAVPTIFVNEALPTHLHHAVKKARKPPSQRSSTVPKARKPPSQGSSSVLKIVPEANVKAEESFEKLELSENQSPDLFKTNLESFQRASLPQNWIYFVGSNSITFRKLTEDSRKTPPDFHIEITLIIADQLEPKCFLRGTEVDLTLEHSVETHKWTTAIRGLDSILLCPGVPNFNSMTAKEGRLRHGNAWYSPNCILFSETTCQNCCEIRKELVEEGAKIFRIIPRGHPKLNLKSNVSHKTLSQKIRRLSVSLTSHKSLLKQLRINLLKMKEETLSNAIKREEGLSEEMKTSMIAAANVAKCRSAKGRRYAANWLLQCLLLKITSPKAYRFLRDNQILALPHQRHLTRLIQGIPCQFGFNEFVFSELKKQFSAKNKEDRQFMLLFDEIKVRETVDFDKVTGSFLGYIDYAEFTEDYMTKARPSSSKLADHALVLMCKNLRSKVVQPLASFASRGAAPGHILAKIVISCILKLEQASCEVVGVVCDGATPNKSFWKLLGISGKTDEINSSIRNPYNPAREIFFFHDVPHIVKCIRNHFLNYKTVIYDGNPIKWEYYQKILTLEKNRGDLRLASRLKDVHLNPGPFQKMIVSHATQLFSKSVADSIQLCRKELKLKEFEGSQETENFTRKVNDIFDILNAKKPTKGVKVGSKEMEELKDFFKLICENENTFASTTTLESLRVTIQSSIKLVEYLCNEVGFKYVLTAKFNQDSLERFFGVVRSFGGNDSHPTIVSFSYLFRILSLYSPIKTELKGNIRTKDDEQLAMYVNTLTEMSRNRKTQRAELSQSHERRLKEKLVIQTEDTSTSENELNATLCIVFHLCGFIASKSDKFTHCKDCQTSLKTNKSEIAAKVLTDIKSFGWLTYPSDSLYYLISQKIEPIISSKLQSTDLSRGDVLDLVISNVPMIGISGIGCSESHSEELSVKIILYYLTTRCFFHKREINNFQIKSKDKCKNKGKERNLM